MWRYAGLQLIRRYQVSDATPQSKRGDRGIVTETQHSWKWNDGEACPRLSSSSSSGMRTALEYDQQGNLKAVTPGCSTSTGSCPSGAGTSYKHDDFGNVVEVTAPWLGGSSGSGTTYFSYDAGGHMLSKKTPAMGSDSLSYTYDALGRLRSLAHTSPLEKLYALEYDNPRVDDSPPRTPESSCPQPTNAAGRLLSRHDSFGMTWYQYDVFGHVTKEIRLREGATSCSGAAARTRSTRATATPTTASSRASPTPSAAP